MNRETNQDRCYICGHDAPVSLERHHIIPESIGGSDDESNIATLCSNCHRAISDMYDRDTFAKIWEMFQERDSPPSALRVGRPPMGLKWGDDNELDVSDEDLIEQIKEAYWLLNTTELSCKEMAQRFDFGHTKIRELPQLREKYERVIEIDAPKQADLNREWSGETKTTESAE